VTTEGKAGSSIRWGGLLRCLYIGSPSVSSPAHLQPSSASPGEAAVFHVIHPANQTTNHANHSISRTTRQLIMLIRSQSLIELKETNQIGRLEIIAAENKFKKPQTQK
jgi:hypothetical protein